MAKEQRHKQLFILRRCSSKSLIYEDYFTFANSAKPDEILHFMTFHLGLHCLPVLTHRNVKSSPGLELIKHELILKLKICAMIGCLLTRVL